MKGLGLLLLIGSLLPAPGHAASNDAWQTGRIVDVEKNVTTKTLYWLVNTPVTQEETAYVISVHLKDKIFTGRYEVGRVQGPPPDNWVKDRAVKVEIDGDTIYLRGPAGSEFRLNILRRKSAAMMRPVTAKELAEAETVPAANPDESVTGFIPPAKVPPQQPASAAPAAPAPAAEPTGVVDVHTTPYLADIYVDGQNMGNTPAKLTLPPGKHTVRFEKQGYKSWSKEITLTAGSQLLVDASLEKK